MKKLMVGLAPLFVVAAFMVVPAMASAAPQWEVCTKVAEGTGKYKNSTCTTMGGKKTWEWELVSAYPGVGVVSKKAAGSGEAKLDVAGLGGIECKKVEDTGGIWNKGGVGKDFDLASFTECKATEGITGCVVVEPIVVAANTSLLEENGKVYNEYTPPTGEPFTVINLQPAPPCPGELEVTGFARSEVNGSNQVFNAGTGSDLDLGPFSATFEAETTQEGVEGEAIRAS